MSDVWSAGKDGSPAALPATGTPPAVGDLFKQLTDDVQAHFMSYLTAGFGYFAGLFGLVMLLLVLSFSGAIPGIVMQDETVATIGFDLTLLVVYFPGIMVVTLVLVPLMNASLMRALQTQLDGDGMPMGMNAAYSTLRQDMGSVILAQLLLSLVVSIGLLFCYIPGIVLAVALGWAIPLVVLRRVAPVDALKASWAVFSANAAWHVVFVLVTIAIALVCELIPIVGIMVLYPVVFMFQLLAFRALFPGKTVTA
jgi:uncharacterized membrane protein